MKLTFIRDTGIRKFISFCLCTNLLFLTCCIKQERTALVIDNRGLIPSSAHVRSLVDINSASLDELETLPGIGTGLALRIIEHRDRYGRFRRAEHLIMVRGFSDRRFRKLSSLIRAE